MVSNPRFILISNKSLLHYFCSLSSVAKTPESKEIRCMLEIEMQGVDGGRESQTRAWWRTPQQALTAVVP